MTKESYTEAVLQGIELGLQQLAELSYQRQKEAEQTWLRGSDSSSKAVTSKAAEKAVCGSSSGTQLLDCVFPNATAAASQLGMQPKQRLEDAAEAASGNCGRANGGCHPGISVKLLLSIDRREDEAAAMETVRGTSTNCKLMVASQTITSL